MEEEYNNPIILKVYKWPGEDGDRPYEYTFESESEPGYFGSRKLVLEDLDWALRHMKSEVSNG